MEPKPISFPLKSPTMNLIKVAAQPMQFQSNYMPFYNPTTKSPPLIAPVLQTKMATNHEIFKQQHQSISSPKSVSTLLTNHQLALKKINEQNPLAKALNDGQGLLTQREYQTKKPEIKNNGSLSERSIADRKQWFIKEPIESSGTDKENQNTQNNTQATLTKQNKISLNSQKLEKFFLPNNKSKDFKKRELSYNFSRQDDPNDENQDKFHLVKQRLEVSRNLLHQTPINLNESSQKSQGSAYLEFVKELKSHRSEIVDLRMETQGLKEKLYVLETQLQESERRKKLDEVSEILNKANMENRIIRKKTKNSELKRNNYTMGTEELLRANSNRSSNDNPIKNALKKKMEFKKLLQKTDLSKLVIGIGDQKDKIKDKTLKSERNSKNTQDFQSILRRKMSNDFAPERRKLIFKEDNKDNNHSNEEKGNISESLNTLKNRLANFLNNYQLKKKNKDKN